MKIPKLHAVHWLFLIGNILILLTMCLGHCEARASGATSPRRFTAAHPTAIALDVVWYLESSRTMHPKDGDHGKAIGPYQIWYVYWLDATHVRVKPKGGKPYWKRVHPGEYADCRRFDYAQRVVCWSWEKHNAAALSAGNLEVLIRSHNGGPQYSRGKTEGYWQRAVAYMRERHRQQEED